MLFSYEGLQNFYSASRVSRREYTGSFWFKFRTYQKWASQVRNASSWSLTWLVTCPPLLHTLSISIEKSGSGTNFIPVDPSILIDWPVRSISDRGIRNDILNLCQIDFTKPMRYRTWSYIQNRNGLKAFEIYAAHIWVQENFRSSLLFKKGLPCVYTDCLILISIYILHSKWLMCVLKPKKKDSFLYAFVKVEFSFEYSYITA